MKRVLLAATVSSAVLCALGLTSCLEDVNATAQKFTRPLYAPSKGILPVPNDLLYSGSLDATLNIPVADPTDFSDPMVALNALDGWSVDAPFQVEFDKPVDLTTFVPGSSIRIFEVTTLVTPTQPVGGPVTGVTSELTSFSVQAAPEVPTGEVVRVLPNQALKAATTYMVVLTNGLMDAKGRKLRPAEEWELLSDAVFEPGSSQETAQILIQAMRTAAEGQGIAHDDQVLTYTFTTQGTQSALVTTFSIATGNEAAVIASLCAQLPFGCSDTSLNPNSTPVAAVPTTPLGTTATFVPSLSGSADVYQGSLQLPYYLVASSNQTNNGPSVDPAALTGFWKARYEFFPGDTEKNVSRFNPLPWANSAESIPLLITVPPGPLPPNGWPVAVFQHGITGNRTHMLPVGDTLAQLGIACVAIDLPLHGISPEPGASDPLLPLFTGFADGATRERTFGIDFLDNATGLPGSDGTPDTSGANFINLASLLTSRDNLRQGATDLFNLLTVLPSIDFLKNASGDGGTDGLPDFDANRIHFIGHSLGAMVGSVALAIDSRAQTATLGMPGMGTVKFLNASPTFGPILQGGLASAGILPGTPDFEGFLFAAQTVIDSGDPAAYGQNLAVTNRPIHLIEVVGGGPGGGLPDQTIPNTVADAPLAGTEPLIALIGLPGVSMTTSNPGGVRGAVRFIEGTHGSLITPGVTPAELAAFLEMQSELAGFAASNGQTLTITDSSVIQ